MSSSTKSKGVSYASQSWGQGRSPWPCVPQGPAHGAASVGVGDDCGVWVQVWTQCWGVYDWVCVFPWVVRTGCHRLEGVGGALKQQEFPAHSSGGWKSQIGGARPLWFLGGALFPACRCLQCAHVVGLGRGAISQCLIMNALISRWELLPCYLTTSPKPHLQTPSPWR